MSKENHDEYSHEYAEWQVNRSNSLSRRIIKKFYVDRVLSEVEGLAIDFGCGAGQILSKLPKGSIGLEINKALINILNKKGMDVKYYDAFSDDFSLTIIPKNQYQTLIISHVLEHFSNSDEVMKKLWQGAAKVGIKKIIVVLPGKKGYESDSTHRTFINSEWIENKTLSTCGEYKLKHMDFFPINKESFGDKFIYNEMRLIYALS